ncbi:MAG: hypothetical protein LBD06_07260, partial [Candidatus Accumulibacter sp.]|nr:hypothetical protein [Accumulibacter sp.]
MAVSASENSFRGRGSEDSNLRGQKTDEFAALRAVQRTENRTLGFRGQSGLRRQQLCSKSSFFYAKRSKSR